MLYLAINYLNEGGMIIFDNSDGYGFYEGWMKYKDFLRIDFYGHAPGVISPHSTSILFKSNCIYLKNSNPIFKRGYKYKELPYIN